MSIDRKWDENSYIKLSRSLSFFHWGEECLISWHDNDYYFADTIETSILFNCTGHEKIGPILNKVAKQNSVSISSLEESLNNLIAKGILRICISPYDNPPHIYGEKGKYYPKGIDIELTNSCNFNCPFCYKSAEQNGHMLSMDTINEIYRMINKKVKYVMLTGGEPTLHPCFDKIVSMFSESHELSFISNGSTLYRWKGTLDLRNVTSIQFSLYGRNKEDYTKRTGMDAGLEHLAKSISFAEESNTPYILSATLTEEDISHMEEYINTAINLGAKDVKFGLFEQYGRGKNIKKITPTDVSLYFSILKGLQKKYKDKINIHNAMPLSPEKRDPSVNRLYETRLNCGGAMTELVVSQDGAIRPCEYLPESIFNLGDCSILQKMINGKSIENELSTSLKKYLTQIHNDRELLCDSLRTFADSRAFL